MREPHDATISRLRLEIVAYQSPPSGPIGACCGLGAALRAPLGASSEAPKARRNPQMGPRGALGESLEATISQLGLEIVVWQSCSRERPV